MAFWPKGKVATRPNFWNCFIYVYYTHRHIIIFFKQMAISNKCVYVCVFLYFAFFFQMTAYLGVHSVSVNILCIGLSHSFWWLPGSKFSWSIIICLASLCWWTFQIVFSLSLLPHCIEYPCPYTFTSAPISVGEIPGLLD